MSTNAPTRASLDGASLDTLARVLERIPAAGPSSGAASRPRSAGPRSTARRDVGMNSSTRGRASASGIQRSGSSAASDAALAGTGVIAALMSRGSGAQVALRASASTSQAPAVAPAESEAQQTSSSVSQRTSALQALKAQRLSAATAASATPDALQHEAPKQASVQLTSSGNMTQPKQFQPPSEGPQRLPSATPKPVQPKAQHVIAPPQQQGPAVPPSRSSASNSAHVGQQAQGTKPAAVQMAADTSGNTPSQVNWPGAANRGDQACAVAGVQEQQLRLAEDANRALQEQLVRMQEALQAAGAEKQELQKQLGATQQVVKQLKDHMSDDKAIAVETLSLELSRAQAALAAEKEQNRRLAGANEELSTQLADSAWTATRDGSDLSKLQAVHAQLLQEHAALKAKVESEHALQATQEADITRLRADLEAAHARAQAAAVLLETQTRSESAAMAALQQQVASLQDEKEGLRTHLARVQRDSASLYNKKLERDAALLNLKKRCDALAQQLAEQEKDAKEKGQGATALEARMATLRQRCAALEKSLEKEVARRERAEKEAQLLEEEVTLLVGLLNGNQDLAQLLRSGMTYYRPLLGEVGAKLDNSPALATAAGKVAPGQGCAERIAPSPLLTRFQDQPKFGKPALRPASPQVAASTTDQVKAQQGVASVSSAAPGVGSRTSAAAALRARSPSPAGLAQQRLSPPQAKATGSTLSPGGQPPVKHASDAAKQTSPAQPAPTSAGHAALQAHTAPQSTGPLHPRPLSAGLQPRTASGAVLTTAVDGYSRSAVKAGPGMLGGTTRPLSAGSKPHARVAQSTSGLSVTAGTAVASMAKQEFTQPRPKCQGITHHNTSPGLSPRTRPMTGRPGETAEGLHGGQSGPDLNHLFLARIIRSPSPVRPTTGGGAAASTTGTARGSSTPRHPAARRAQSAGGALTADARPPARHASPLAARPLTPTEARRRTHHSTLPNPESASAANTTGGAAQAGPSGRQPVLTAAGAKGAAAAGPFLVTHMREAHPSSKAGEYQAQPPCARGRHAAPPLRGRVLSAGGRGAPARSRGPGTTGTQPSVADNTGSLSGMSNGAGAPPGGSKPGVSKHGAVSKLQPPLVAMSPVIRGPRKYTAQEDASTLDLRHGLRGASDSNQGWPTTQGALAIAPADPPARMVSQQSDSLEKQADERSHMTLTVTPTRPVRHRHAQDSPQSSPEVSITSLAALIAHAGNSQEEASSSSRRAIALEDEDAVQVALSPSTAADGGGSSGSRGSGVESVMAASMPQPVFAPEPRAVAPAGQQPAAALSAEEQEATGVGDGAGPSQPVAVHFSEALTAQQPHRRHRAPAGRNAHGSLLHQHSGSMTRSSSEQGAIPHDHDHLVQGSTVHHRHTSHTSSEYYASSHAEEEGNEYLDQGGDNYDAEAGGMEEEVMESRGYLAGPSSGVGTSSRQSSLSGSDPGLTSGRSSSRGTSFVGRPASVSSNPLFQAHSATHTDYGQRSEHEPWPEHGQGVGTSAVGDGAEGHQHSATHPNSPPRSSLRLSRSNRTASNSSNGARQVGFPAGSDGTNSSSGGGTSAPAGIQALHGRPSTSAGQVPQFAVPVVVTAPVQHIHQAIAPGGGNARVQRSRSRSMSPARNNQGSWGGAQLSEPGPHGAALHGSFTSASIPASALAALGLARVNSPVQRHGSGRTSGAASGEEGDVAVMHFVASPTQLVEILDTRHSAGVPGPSVQVDVVMPGQQVVAQQQVLVQQQHPPQQAVVAQQHVVQQQPLPQLPPALHPAPAPSMQPGVQAATLQQTGPPTHRHGQQHPEQPSQVQHVQAEEEQEAEDQRLPAEEPVHVEHVTYAALTPAISHDTNQQQFSEHPSTPAAAVNLTHQAVQQRGGSSSPDSPVLQRAAQQQKLALQKSPGVRTSPGSPKPLTPKPSRTAHVPSSSPAEQAQPLISNASVGSSSAVHIHSGPGEGPAQQQGRQTAVSYSRASSSSSPSPREGTLAGIPSPPIQQRIEQAQEALARLTSHLTVAAHKPRELRGRAAQGTVSDSQASTTMSFAGEGNGAQASGSNIDISSAGAEVHVTVSTRGAGQQAAPTAAHITAASQPLPVTSTRKGLTAVAPAASAVAAAMGDQLAQHGITVPAQHVVTPAAGLPAQLATLLAPEHQPLVAAIAELLRMPSASGVSPHHASTSKTQEQAGIPISAGGTVTQAVQHAMTPLSITSSSGGGGSAINISRTAPRTSADIASLTARTLMTPSLALSNPALATTSLLAPTLSSHHTSLAAQPAAVPAGPASTVATLTTSHSASLGTAIQSEIQAAGSAAAVHAPGISHSAVAPGAGVLSAAAVGPGGTGIKRLSLAEVLRRSDHA